MPEDIRSLEASRSTKKQQPADHSKLTWLAIFIILFAGAISFLINPEWLHNAQEDQKVDSLKQKQQIPEQSVAEPEGEQSRREMLAQSEPVIIPPDADNNQTVLPDRVQDILQDRVQLRHRIEN